MVNQVIDLVITMNDSASISRPHSMIAEEVEHLIHIWNSTNSFSRLDVLYFSLRLGYCSEGHNLSIVESPWLSKSRKSYRSWINAM
jgi:hypothetical protein